jgi:hypothetical protein
VDFLCYISAMLNFKDQSFYAYLDNRTMPK